MPDAIQIRRLQTIGDREIQGLSHVLIDCVEGGASVSFMLPMSRAKAEAYWHSTSASVARGERVVLTSPSAAHNALLATLQRLSPKTLRILDRELANLLDRAQG